MPPVPVITMSDHEKHARYKDASETASHPESGPDAVDDAAAALPEMPIPQGALDDGADLDVVARQDLRRQLDDLAAEGHRKKNMKTLADLVEAGLDNT